MTYFSYSWIVQICDRTYSYFCGQLISKNDLVVIFTAWSPNWQNMPSMLVPVKSDCHDWLGFKHWILYNHSHSFLYPFVHHLPKNLDVPWSLYEHLILKVLAKDTFLEIHFLILFQFMILKLTAWNYLKWPKWVNGIKVKWPQILS